MTSKSPTVYYDKDGKRQEHNGIDIHSNTEWVATTATGIGILHFLVPIFLHLLYFPWLLISLALACAPGIGVGLITNNSHQWHWAAVILVLIGLYFWGKYNWRLAKWMWRRFVGATRYNFTDGYEGPLSKRSKY